MGVSELSLRTQQILKKGFLFRLPLEGKLSAKQTDEVKVRLSATSSSTLRVFRFASALRATFSSRRRLNKLSV
jgi:hypothetical protein